MNSKKYTTEKEMIDDVTKNNKANLISMTDIKMDKQIGNGQFGAVYKGEWEGNTVAVKQLNPQIDHTEQTSINIKSNENEFKHNDIDYDDKLVLLMYLTLDLNSKAKDDVLDRVEHYGTISHSLIREFKKITMTAVDSDEFKTDVMRGFPDAENDYGNTSVELKSSNEKEFTHVKLTMDRKNQTMGLGEQNYNAIEMVEIETEMKIRVEGEIEQHFVIIKMKNKEVKYWIKCKGGKRHTNWLARTLKTYRLVAVKKAKKNKQIVKGYGNKTILNCDVFKRAIRDQVSKIKKSNRYMYYKVAMETSVDQKYDNSDKYNKLKEKKQRIKEMEAEIVLASSVPTHNNLVEIFAYIRSPFGVVMNYMSGGSVQKYVYRKYKSDTDKIPTIIELLIILLKAASGIKHLHIYGLIHRDIACRNILLGKIGNN
eukprot:426773_1